jgi:hypothetical protein
MTEKSKCLNPKSLTCYQFQTRLPELIGSEKDLAAHSHLDQCPICGALLEDLESISEAARLLFPIAEPPDDLWKQIESAIEEEKGRLEPEDEEE